MVKRMINYNKLYYFYLVSKVGNMSRVAEDLYISQPALSKAIKDLETYFGVELFGTNRRNLVLTPAGEALRKECMRIFADEDGLLMRMRQFQEEKQKTIKFGYMIYREISRMQRIFSGFAKEYSHIQLAPVSYIERSHLTADLMSGKVDVGLKLFTMEDVLPELDFRVMDESHLAVIMHEEHPLAGRKELHLSELAGEKFVFLGKDSSSSEYNTIKNWCHRCGFEPNVAEGYDHVGMVLMMVRTGFGITMLSDLAPLDLVNGLVMVPLVNAPVFYSGLFWRKDGVEPGVIQFVDYYLNHRNIEMGGIRK